MLSVTYKPFMLSVEMLIVIVLSLTYKPSILNVDMLIVVMLIVVMLSVMAPTKFH